MAMVQLLRRQKMLCKRESKCIAWSAWRVSLGCKRERARVRAPERENERASARESVHKLLRVREERDQEKGRAGGRGATTTLRSSYTPVYGHISGGRLAEEVGGHEADMSIYGPITWRRRLEATKQQVRAVSGVSSRATRRSQASIARACHGEAQASMGGKSVVHWGSTLVVT